MDSSEEKYEGWDGTQEKNKAQPCYKCRQIALCVRFKVNGKFYPFCEGCYESMNV